MPTNLRHFGAFVLTALIALANPTHAFVDETCGEAVCPATAPRVADARTAPSDDDTGDGEQGAVDLGDQPVLLLYHAFKPIPQSAPAPIEWRVIAVGCQVCEVGARPLLECADPDEVASVRPRRHAGISLMPHGPPSATT